MFGTFCTLTSVDDFMKSAIPFTCKSEWCLRYFLRSCSTESGANITGRLKRSTANVAHCTEPPCSRTTCPIGIEQAILNYSKVVINVEWAALKRREASPEAGSAFQAIVEVAGHLNTTRPTDLTLQGQILSLLAQAHTYRETRIFQADQGLPMIIWAVLAFYSLALVVFVLFAGVESRIAHLLFTAVFATSVVLLLILLKMLDYPFEGALTLSNADFVKTIERVIYKHDDGRGLGVARSVKPPSSALPDWAQITIQLDLGRRSLTVPPPSRPPCRWARRFRAGV